jgi:hypothetical protein
MTAWSHLPNAEHIDRVLAHALLFPESWNLPWSDEFIDSLDEAMTTAQESNRDLVWQSAWQAPWVNRQNKTFPADSLRAIRACICTLIAYDDSSKYLNCSPEKLKMIISLTEDRAAILMLPAAVAFEKTKEVDNKSNS